MLPGRGGQLLVGMGRHDRGVDVETQLGGEIGLRPCRPGGGSRAGPSAAKAGEVGDAHAVEHPPGGDGVTIAEALRAEISKRGITQAQARPRTTKEAKRSRLPEMPGFKSTFVG